MAERPRILLVDDDPNLLRLLAIRLQFEGYDIQTADNGRAALGLLASFRPHVVITDMCLDGMDGMSLFDVIRAKEPTLPVVMLTAHGSIPDAVDATERGMFAYLTKPFERTHLLDTIARALDLTGAYFGASTSDGAWSENIVTRCTAMESLLREAWLVAQSDATVLIRGESGTGKELLARAIHKASRRRLEPMTAINCTAIPDSLFEAELFGHTRGAFTGATQSRHGLLRAADGGTVFLDEVGDMPLSFQVKLLRMLQERQIRPVGATKAEDLDVRVISATHQDLEAAIEEKRFRADLYYRLDVVTLEIPPLESRREDIPLLVDHFLAKAWSRSKGGDRVHGFSSQAMELLIGAAWPGNVRQLQNVVDQCLALSTEPYVSASLVRRALQAKEKTMMSFSSARDKFECDYLTDILATTEGNVAQAARLACKNRSEFYRLMSKHSLEAADFRRRESEL